MKTRLLKAFFLFLITPSVAFSQSVDIKDAGRFNIALLGVLDEYERTCTFSETKDQRDFLRLFAQENEACIYNDLLGTDHFQAMVSPREYCGLVNNDGSSLIRSSISDVRKEGGISSSDGKLYRRISYTKYIMIIDGSVYTGGEGGVLFDSSQAYDSKPDFRLFMDLSYDPVEGECRIESVRIAEEKPETPFDDSRFSVIISSNNKYEEDLTSRGEKLKFNEFGQSIAYWNDIDVDNGDVKLMSTERAQGDHYNVLAVDFKPIRFRGKAYGNLTLGNAFDIQSSYSGMVSSSSAMNFGIDLGFEKALAKKFRIGVYAGAGLSLGKINLEAQNVSYTLDYVTPSRNYAFSAKENLKITDIVVPVYIEGEIDLGKRLVLDIDAGVRFYLNWQTSLSPYEVEGTIGGSNVKKEYNSFKDPTDYTRNMYDIVVFGNVELDFAIIKKSLFAYLSAGYEQGLKPVYDSSERAYFQQNNNIYPFYYSPVSDSDIPMRSLVGSVRYSRKAGWAAAGLKIKF